MSRQYALMNNHIHDVPTMNAKAMVNIEENPFYWVSSYNISAATHRSWNRYSKIAYTSVVGCK